MAHQKPQDVSLDPEIVGHDQRAFGFGRKGFRSFEAEHGIAPIVGLIGGHAAYHVDAHDRFHSPGQGHGLGFGGKAGQDHPSLGAFGAKDADELAGIDTGDPGDSVFDEEGIEGQRPTAPIRGDGREISDHEAFDLHLRRFHVLGRDAVVADFGIGHGHDLPAVGRIGQDFLVAGHGRVEYHLAGGLMGRPEADSSKDGSVFQRQGRFTHSDPPVVFPG